MISKQIMAAAQRAMPVEERIVNAAHEFFGNKTRRFVVCAVASLLVGGFIMNLSGDTHEMGFFILETLLLGILISLVGCFFANIGDFSAKRFALTSVAAGVVIYVIYSFVSTLSVVDLSVMPLFEAFLFVLWYDFPCFAAALAAIPLCTLIASTRKRKA